jgi:ATP/maltotriose-dependent transcriptional regulator MalT
VTVETDEPIGRLDAPRLLVTKLHPPFVPAQTVERERLFVRLRDGRGLKLSLVACPAGFGKSTLLAAWREREAEDRPVAWVSLDESDDDAVVLWSHVVEALGRVCPAVRDSTPAEAVAAAPLLEVVLPRLVNELVEQAPLVLILDDFHRLSSAAARESVAWFVDHLPATVQLVLSTRADPALPLGALRAHGQLLELRADDLRFTVAEADEFLNGRLGLELADADVDLLVSRTEGWPAGIYLAALSLAGTADRPALVRAFDGTSAHVVDFLSTEVLGAYESWTSRSRRVPWARWRARTSSWCRSTTSAGGSAFTICSPNCCGSSWSGASPASPPSSTAARTSGIASSAPRTRRSITPSPPWRSERPRSS